MDFQQKGKEVYIDVKQWLEIRRRVLREGVEVTENSLKDNAKVILTEKGISPQIILGDLPLQLHSSAS